MKLHQSSVAEALESLHSRMQGLTCAEAAQRLREYGPNRVEAAPRASLAWRFLKEFTHFFALILWLAAVLAFTAELYDPGQGMGVLGAAILGVILINGLFSFWQECRAEKALAALRRLLPVRVLVRREDAVREIPAETLVPGDILYLKEGDKVPADCLLLESFGVRVNNATLTGESLPKARRAGASDEDELAQGRNILLAGTSLVSGEAQAVVFATGMHTEFGKIAHLTQVAKEPVSPLQREIERVSRWVAMLATALGVVFFLIGQWIGLTFWQNLMFAIGIIVANVPEGLLPTVTLALAMATQRMAKRNALIRHLPAVETLGSTTVICTDKTGTLTQNRMRVKTVYYAGSMHAPEEMTPKSGCRVLLDVAAACHSLKAGSAPGTWLGDPMEIALAELAQAAQPERTTGQRVDEVPFDTDRKRMSVLYRLPEGLRLYTKGALETVLPVCSRVPGELECVPLDAAGRQRILVAQEQLADRGLRVLALAYREAEEGVAAADLETDLIFAGLVGLEDPPRPEVAAAIAKCHTAGIRVMMVTGDHPHTACAIAREIGLIRSDAPVVVTGEQLRSLSPEQLQLALDAPEILFARVGADQKMQIVAALKRKQHIVAVTGDGVNDAPALKHAHIGIAMGIAGSDVAKESADMILLDDNFASIVSAIEEGRAVFENIRKFLTYILTSNIPELIPYLAFVLFAIPLPLTIIQILAVDLGTDMLPALGLGAEKPAPGVMQRPPRPRRERLLNAALVLRAYGFLGLMEAVAAMAAFFYVLRQGGWQAGQALAAHAPLYLQATTATLSAIIVMQIANVFLCRGREQPGLFGNLLILWGVAFEIVLILLIDYTPWGQTLFGTAAIGPDVWLFVLPFAFGMILLETTRQWLAGRFMVHR